MTTPNDKFLDESKLKVFADDKLKVAKMTIFLLDKAENTVGKGENAGYQHFLHFPQCFPKPSSLWSLKVGIVWCTFKHAISFEKGRKGAGAKRGKKGGENACYN